MKLYDILAYTLLLFGLLIGVVAILVVRFDAGAQFIVLLLILIFYVGWAAIYHIIKGDLGKKLLLEYLLLALLSAAVGILVFVI